MQEVTLTLINRLGLHARSAAKTCEFSSKIFCRNYFTQKYTVGKCQKYYGCDDVGAPKGTSLIVRAEGDDANDALTAISDLFASGFGESE